MKKKYILEFFLAIIITGSSLINQAYAMAIEKNPAQKMIDENQTRSPLYFQIDIFSEPITRIKNIMRKYHRNNIHHTLQETNNDIIELKDIISQAHMPSLKNALILEIMNNCLFKIFHYPHHQETLAYIDNIIEQIPEVNAKLLFSPHSELDNNNLYKNLKKNWDTITGSQRLIFHLILSYDSIQYFFDVIQNYSPQNALDRIKIAITSNIMNDLVIESNVIFKDCIFNIIYANTRNIPVHKSIWKKFNKALDKQDALFHILYDQPQELHLKIISNRDKYLYYGSFETIILEKNNNRLSINHLQMAILFGAKNAYAVYRALLETNDPLFQVDHVIDDLQIPFLNEEQHKKIINAALLSGDNHFINDIMYTFPITAPMTLESKILFQQANLLDRPCISEKIKNQNFLTAPSEQYASPNYCKPIIPDLIDATIISNDKEMQEFNKTCYQDNNILNTPTLTICAIQKGLQEQSELLIAQQKIQLTLITEPQKDIITALNFLHQKITPIQSISQITNDIITEYKTISKKLYTQNQKSYSTYYIFCEAFYGILLHKIFFQTPQKESLDVVDALINNLQEPCCIQPNISMNTTAVTRYIELHPQCTLRPHEILIINIIGSYSHFFTYFKHDIAFFVQLIPFYYISNNKMPFFTQKMFQHDMLELENLAAKQELYPCHLDYSEAQEAYNYSPMCIAALLGDLCYLKNSTFTKEPKPIQEKITLCALNGENSDTMLYCLKHLLCRDPRSEFNVYDIHAYSKDKIHRNIVVQCYLNNKTYILEKFSKKFYSMNYHTNSIHYDTIFTPYLKNDFNPNNDPKRKYIINKVPHAENIVANSHNITLEAELEFNKKIYYDCQKITKSYGFSYLKKMIFLGDPSFFDNYNFPGDKNYLLNLTLCAIASPNENILDFFLDIMFTHTFNDDPANPSGEQVMQKIIMQAFFYHKPNVLDKLINKYNRTITYEHLYPHAIADMDILEKFIQKNPPTQNEQKIINSMLTCAQNTFSYYALFMINKFSTHYFNNPRRNSYTYARLCQSIINNDINTFKTISQKTPPTARSLFLNVENIIRPAISNNNIEFIKEALKENAPLTAAPAQGLNNYTILKKMLLHAIILNRIEIVTLLLDHNAIKCKYALNLFSNFHNTQQEKNAHRLIKKLFENSQYKMLSILFDYALTQEINAANTTNLFMFFYHATQKTEIFLAWFEKLNDTQKEIIKNGNSKNLLPKKIKNQFPTTLYLSVDIIGAATLNNNKQLLERLIKMNFSCQKTCAPLFALHNHHYALLEMLIEYIFSSQKYTNEQEWAISSIIDELASRNSYLEYYSEDDYTHIATIFTNHDTKHILKKNQHPFIINEIIKNLKVETPTERMNAHINTAIQCIVEKICSSNPNITKHIYNNNETLLHIAAAKDKCNHVTTLLLKAKCPITSCVGKKFKLYDLEKPYTTPLDLAIQSDNIYFIQAFLEINPLCINEPDEHNNNQTLLHTAIAYEKYHIAQFLLEKGADAHIKNNQGISAAMLLHSQKNKLLQNKFHSFSERMKNQLNIILNLIAATTPSTTEINNPYEQFQEALTHNNYNQAKNLLEHGFPLLKAEKEYRNLFFQCFNENRNLEIASLILSLYDIDEIIIIEDSQGNSILTNAIYRQDIPLIDLITLHPTYKSNYKKRLSKELFAAIQKGYCEIVEKIMLRNDIKYNKNYLDENFNTPLHIALMNNQTTIALYLIDNEKKLGINNNEFNNNHITPLMYAIEHDMHDIVEKLETITHKPYIEKRNKSGQNILFYAAENNYLKTMRYCLRSSCPHLAVNYQTPTNAITALHAAVEAGQHQAVQLLLEHGAQKNIPNKKNQTPLDLAKKKKLKNIEKLLA